jgi:hypothetical protein
VAYVLCVLLAAWLLFNSTSSLCSAVQVGQQAPAVVGGRQGPGAALQHVAASADGALLVTVHVRQDAGLLVSFAACRMVLRVRHDIEHGVTGTET